MLLQLPKQSFRTAWLGSPYYKARDKKASEVQ